MNIQFKATAVFLVFARLGSMAAYAIPPAYEDEFGNPEEPALRPIKGLIRGLKALVIQPVKALIDGNLKTPIIGSVEVFRGVRRGAVELHESVFMGMAGSLPKEPGELGAANKFIDNDALLKTVSDTATSAAIMAPGTPKGQWYPEWLTFKTGVMATTQQAVDRVPLDENWKEKKLNAKTKRFARTKARKVKHKRIPKKYYRQKDKK